MWWLLGLIMAVAGARDRGSLASCGSEELSRVLIYRSRDGTAFFQFWTSPVGCDVRIYILDLPNAEVGSCHILHDDEGPYICWSRSINSIEEAEAVASLWAELTLQYQRTGRIF